MSADSLNGVTTAPVNAMVLPDYANATPYPLPNAVDLENGAAVNGYLPQSTTPSVKRGSAGTGIRDGLQLAPPQAIGPGALF